MPSDESAKAEIRRQFEQSYALVSSARHDLAEIAGTARAITLLDMAEDVLGELEYIDRLAPPSEPTSGQERAS